MRSVYKNQKQLSHTRSIVREQISLFSIWVLIGYPICCQKPNGIWSHTFDGTLAVFLFSPWVLIGYLICFWKTKSNLVTHIWLQVSSLLVFTLSSHWLSDLLPKTKRNLVIRVWLHMEQFACFQFELWLARQSVSKYQSLMFDCAWGVGLFLLWVLIVYPICFQNSNSIWSIWSHWLFWHLSSFWLAVMTTLVFWFSSLNQIPL